jgi:hypothetical protein
VGLVPRRAGELAVGGACRGRDDVAGGDGRQ